MLTVNEAISKKRKKSIKQDELELRSLPYKRARIYGRVSSPGQVRDSHESIREIGRLVDLAKQDGFRTNLRADEIEKELLKNGGKAGLWEDGEVIVDARDLGLSGQLSAEKRLGLADMQRNIEKGVEGTIYLTEGVSRLSRDKDHILPYELLRLLKKHKCRVRTPEGVWNPAIDRDWEYLADEFEDAIDEQKLMNKRLFRRKAQKAKRGEFVGEPVPPGFIVPITGRKPNGQYEFGKLEPYQPHAEIDEIILKEFISQGGIVFRTVKKLQGVTFPCFPPELSYMERLTSLRLCPRLESGYRITSGLIRGITTNLKLIGISQWGDGEAIPNNHKPAISEALFLEACQLAMERSKPKGKAVHFEPLEWSGLLRCMKHPEPRVISAHGAIGRYICARDYNSGNGPLCLDIDKRFLDEPLDQAVLSQLRLTAQGEKVLLRMETEAKEGRLHDSKNKQEITRLERDLAKWKSLLASCVDDATGKVDKEKEGLYWNTIHEIQKQIDELNSRQLLQVGPTVPDFRMVREFMAGLSVNWSSFPSALRNRFMKCLIDRVEIRGENEIEATIFWKAGFQQQVIIHRQRRQKNLKIPLKNPWTDAEVTILSRRYRTSSAQDMLAALPRHTWHAIKNKAERLQLKRDIKRKRPQNYHLWTVDEDNNLKTEYENGIPVTEIAAHLGRSINAIQVRTAKLKLARDKSVRYKSGEVNGPTLLQQSSSRREEEFISRREHNTTIPFSLKICSNIEE
jgi:hypothetical protein